MSEATEEIVYFKGTPCTFEYQQYPTGNKAILLTAPDGLPEAVITVNLSNIPEGQIALDVNNCGEDAVLVANILGWVATGETLSSGYCKYPLFEKRS